MRSGPAKRTLPVLENLRITTFCPTAKIAYKVVWHKKITTQLFFLFEIFNVYVFCIRDEHIHYDKKCTASFAEKIKCYILSLRDGML